MLQLLNNETKPKNIFGLVLKAIPILSTGPPVSQAQKVSSKMSDYLDKIILFLFGKNPVPNLKEPIFSERIQSVFKRERSK